MRGEKRDYARFILLSLSLPLLYILSYSFPELLQSFTFFIIVAISLYMAAILSPVFRSWKASSASGTMSYAVEDYVEEIEVVAEAKGMVDIICKTYYPSKGETRSKKNYQNKFDEVHDRLIKCADEHYKKAKELEELSDTLISSRTKHYQGQKGKQS